VANFLLHCFRLGYVLLFSFWAQGQMSQGWAVEKARRQAAGVRRWASDLGRLTSDLRDRFHKRGHQLFFRPFGAVLCGAFHPRLAPWAVFFRHFVASDRPRDLDRFRGFGLFTRLRSTLRAQMGSLSTWLA